MKARLFFPIFELARFYTTFAQAERICFMDGFGAILLAGGRSSRMGRDKAALEIDGTYLLERLIKTVSPLVSRIVVMLSADQVLPFDVSSVGDNIEVGRDSRAGQGPLQGIADALQFLNSELNSIFVLTCDLPYLTTDWLRTMPPALIRGVDAVCAEHDGFVNPLLALYRKEVLLCAPQFLAADQRSCLVLIRGQRLTRLAAPSDNPLVCTDINTPQEYLEVRKRLSDFRPTRWRF
ncbi:MAG: molybdenum cofactor guanylyltransferase [Proteobacteria bacterium]|nr:molybdenum cofactor guanylyltransferase [Pseudomonadota bacterium]